jgi:hypothetical protein
MSPVSDFSKLYEKRMNKITVTGFSNVEGKVISKVNPVLKDYAINLDSLHQGLEEKNKE